MTVSKIDTLQYRAGGNRKVHYNFCAGALLSDSGKSIYYQLEYMCFYKKVVYKKVVLSCSES